MLLLTNTGRDAYPHSPPSCSTRNARVHIHGIGQGHCAACTCIIGIYLIRTNDLDIITIYDIM